MLDFLDVFEAVPNRRKRRSSAFNALGRLVGLAFLLLFFCLTIYALW